MPFLLSFLSYGGLASCTLGGLLALVGIAKGRQARQLGAALPVDNLAGESGGGTAAAAAAAGATAIIPMLPTAGQGGVCDGGLSQPHPAAFPHLVPHSPCSNSSPRAASPPAPPAHTAPDPLPFAELRQLLALALAHLPVTCAPPPPPHAPLQS